jgi:hypothetical protein
LFNPISMTPKSRLLFVSVIRTSQSVSQEGNRSPCPAQVIDGRKVFVFCIAEFRRLLRMSTVPRHISTFRTGSFSRLLCLGALVLFLYQSCASLLSQDSRSPSTPSVVSQLQIPTMGLDNQQTKQSHGHSLQASPLSNSHDIPADPTSDAGTALACLFSSPPLSSFLVFTQTAASYL